MEKIPQQKDAPTARDEAGKVANDLRPFYDEKAKERMAVRGEILPVQQIAQVKHEPKAREEAGKVAGVNANKGETLCTVCTLCTARRAFAERTRTSSDGAT